jgi:PD-(D/E)XK endonuclease
MLTTDQKGAVAETAIAFAAIKLGIGVYRPLFEGGRFDFIFEVGGELYRIQCKWAPRAGDTLVVRCYSARRTRDGLRRRTYTAAEIDAIAAYSPDLDRCFVIPISVMGARPEMRLRIAPCRNNQRNRINWADDFAFEALNWLPRRGAIAQLGERVHGMHEVAGSSPAGSTEEAAHDGRLRLL